MKKFIITLISACACFGFTSLTAQNDMIIQGMRIIPQSYYSNPAFIPQCRVHVGIPGLSSLYVSEGFNGFNANDVLSVNIQDSVLVDMESLVKSLRNHNSINLETNYELLSFGFKFKEKHYVNFSLTEKMFARVSYPKDLIEFVFYGNGAMLDETLDVGNFRFNETHYREYAFGYSYLYDDKWTFGARGKLLFGKSNINTKRSDITLRTESEFFDITATSDLLINTNEIQLMTDTTRPDSVEYDFGRYIMLNNNVGLGIDLGATYKYDDKLTLGLSVLDLGFISWKSNPMNFSSVNPNGTFTYDGVDVTEFVNSSDSLMQQKLENTLDSVIEIFAIDTMYTKYKTSLNTRIHLSAFYELTKKDYLSGLVRLHFYDRTVHPSLSLAYMRKFGNILHVTGTYAITNRNYANFGIGLSLKFGAFQIYALTDNIFGPLIWNRYTWTKEEDMGGGLVNFSTEKLTIPRNWKYMNVHFGMNLLFGCKPPKDFVPIID